MLEGISIILGITIGILIIGIFIVLGIFLATKGVFTLLVKGVKKFIKWIKEV